MERGKMIVIEGTDCSGKETQSNLLIQKLTEMGKDTVYFSFPYYKSSTGKIVGLCYLGKPYLGEQLIDDNIEEIKSSIDGVDDETVNKVLDAVKKSLGKGWFQEGAPNVDMRVASLYYAADRLYNLPVLERYLSHGVNVVLDRYVYSNMGHQAGKCQTPEERDEAFEWIGDLEFGKLHLPEPDAKIFLHMPTDYSVLLKQGRAEKADELERDTSHLRCAERAYCELAEKYGFETISCIRDTEGEISRDNIKTPEEINDEVFTYINKVVYKNGGKGHGM